MAKDSYQKAAVVYYSGDIMPPKFLELPLTFLDIFYKVHL